MSIGIGPEAIVAALVALVGGGGLWAYLGAHGKTKADLITIAQDAASKVISELRQEIERLRDERDEDRRSFGARIEELESQDERCRTELADLKRRLA